MEALIRSSMNGKKKKPEVVTQLLPDGTKEEKVIQPKVDLKGVTATLCNVTTIFNTTTSTALYLTTGLVIRPLSTIVADPSLSDYIRERLKFYLNYTQRGSLF